MAKTIIGVVTSNKADKTIVITTQTRKTHPLYRKQYTVSTKFMAHDEKNEAEVGDKVVIIECRPISRRKRFTLSEIIEKPTLRADSLSAVSSEDTGKTASKAKKEDEEVVVEAKAETKVKAKATSKEAAK
jgi:small subunit ribosomal protein S17